MTYVRTANKCFLCVQTMSGLPPGVKCQVTVFVLNQISLSQTLCDLVLYKHSRPYHSGLWRRRTLAPDVEKFLAKHPASSLFEVLVVVFEVVRHSKKSHCSCHRRAHASPTSVSTRCHRTHRSTTRPLSQTRRRRARTRDPAVHWPASTSKRRLGYDGHPIRLHVVDVVTDDSELVGEILHHPDRDSSTILRDRST
jgi:hypothetical protein